jgi:ABC-type uncharacterized transport system substrate-binding protein
MTTRGLLERRAVNRRGFLGTLGGALLSAPLSAAAQPGLKAARVGILLNARWAPVEVFSPALRERGWIEGQTITIHWRSAEGRFERHPALAAELVRLKPDVIVTGSNRAVIATRHATDTIPIVFVGASDPVAAGFVTSLAKPGGMMTGLSMDVTPQEAARDLALLRETLPRITRVAYLWNPTPSGSAYWVQMQAAAPALKMTLQSVELAKPEDLDHAFAEMIREGAEALYVRVDALIYSMRSRLLDFSRRRRLPTLATLTEFAQAGSLMSHAVHWGDLWYRAAVYVDKILRGTKPAELPVEQPTKYEMIINAKTARTLRLTIPQSVLLRADRVLE